MRRRDALRLLAATPLVGVGGCTGARNGSSSGTPTRVAIDGPGDAPPCDEYVYEPPADGQDEGPFPADVHINRIGVSAIPVSISITNISTDPSRHVLSCTADSEAETRLVFDLEPDAEYRVEAILHRPEEPEYARTTTVWKFDKSDALVVEIDNDGEFTVGKHHVDGYEPVTATG